VTAIRLRIEPPAGPPSDSDWNQATITFGRGADSDVVVSDQSMSRHHARVAMDADTWVVEDLGARNGTYVNGERINGRRRIVPGDVIKMGATVVRVGGPRAEPAGALGRGDLSSSIFRRVTEITGELDLPGAAPSRVAARLKAINEFHRALAGPISLDALLETLLERLFTALVSRRLISEVVDKGTAALVTDLAIDERFTGSDSIMGSGVRSILAAPISDAAECIGMVAIYSRAHVRRFGEEDMELLVSLASAAALRIRNVALAEEAAERRVQDHELALAHEIQMAMLPRHVAERPELEMDAALIPARAVGGDLYDFLIVDDALWFIVADAAGKGVSAALFMAVTRTLFRAVAHDQSSVAAVTERMNAELARDNERQFFVTALIGRLDLRTGALTYVNAGHLPPLCGSASSTPRPLEAADGGIALGILEDARYYEGRATLAAGDALLLITDGVTEAINGKGEQFSDARLRASFAASAAQPIRQVVAEVVGAVSAFAAGQPQEDDITVLAFRYRGRS
jgi:serine phosphatase RsbU (regulator of sigma subunit)